MSRSARVASWLFGLAAAWILLSSVAATMAIDSGGPPYLRKFFRPLCHGTESRCFTIGNTPMPICARCTGIYAGLLVTALAFATVRKLQRTIVPSWLAVAFVLPLAVDGITQVSGLRESTNELRLATGLFAGMALVGWTLTHFGPAEGQEKVSPAGEKQASTV